MYLVMITFKRWKILDVDVGMRGRNSRHVYTIQHYWDHIVGEDLEILFCHIIFTEGILQCYDEFVLSALVQLFLFRERFRKP